MSSITAILHKNLQGYLPPDISSGRGEQCPRAKAWRKLWGRRERECPGSEVESYIFSRKLMSVFVIPSQGQINDFSTGVAHILRLQNQWGMFPKCCNLRIGTKSKTISLEILAVQRVCFYIYCINCNIHNLFCFLWFASPKGTFLILLEMFVVHSSPLFGVIPSLNYQTLALKRIATSLF